MNGQVRRRQLWVAVHRYLGLSTLLFLGLASATGIILSFDKQIDALLNADLFTTRRAATIDPQPAIAAFSRSHPTLLVTSFPLVVPQGSTLMATVASRAHTPAPDYDQVFIDGDDGHIAGTRRSAPGLDRRHFVQGVYQFHYTLLAGTAGRWLMGLVALGWLVGNLVGVYLTMPIKGAFWRLWRKSWSFRWRDPAVRLMHDMHRATGLWALIGITVLAFTSVSMNFFEEVFTPAVDRVSPARPSPFDRAVRSSIAPPRIAPATATATARSAAQRLGMQWRPAKISYDTDYGLYRVLLTDNGVENYHGLGPQSLYVDGTTGRVVHVDDPYTDSAGRKLSRALYPLHTGQVAGWFGVGVVVLLAGTTLEMCVSAVYLWWKRRRGRIAGQRARRARERAKVAAA